MGATDETDDPRHGRRQLQPEGPPEDPEAWSDEQWLAWLAATDDGPQPAVPAATRLGRMTSTGGGAALGNAMTGLANAIYGPKRDEVAIVVEAPGGPAPEEPFEVRLDPSSPERSQVVHRRLPVAAVPGDGTPPEDPPPEETPPPAADRLGPPPPGRAP